MNEPLPTTRHTTLLVAGMHRSGTSALTRLLNLLGATLPANLMAPHSQFNPTGFWESNDVIAINDQLLREAGSHWDDVRALPLEALPAATQASFRKAVDQLRQAYPSQDSPLVIKDPRIARLLPLWIEALQQQRSAVMVVITVRHPLEVAASLARREGFGVERSVSLWLRHVLDAIRYSTDVPCAIVVYDELMRDWHGTLERLRQELDLVWPTPITQAESAIEHFLDQDLRHHQADPQALEALRPHAITQWAMRLYEALLHRAPDLADLADLAERIHQELSELEHLYAPLLEDYQRQRERERDEHGTTRQALAKAYQHAEELEQRLRAERLVYQHLEAEFATKCDHVQLLQSEVADLKHAIQAGETSLPSASPNLLDPPVSLMGPLRALEQQVRAQQDQSGRLHREHLRDRDALTRTQAQLDLLKELLAKR